MMRTFWIHTLGCKVNQYESEQLATLLRSRGLVEVDSARRADLRIINSCSVTVQAASKSRQSVRRATRLPVLGNDPAPPSRAASAMAEVQHALDHPNRPRVIVTGCWATSDKSDAQRLGGVDGVIGHHDDLAAELDRLLESWNHRHSRPTRADRSVAAAHLHVEPSPKPLGDEGSITRAGASAAQLTDNNKPPSPEPVKQNLPTTGTRRLPLLGERQASHQRALLKVQDGCDAHCTYCIIPQLRPTLWSKPVNEVVEEARRLTAAGHREIVLTGIFLGAYGHPTALRRRRQQPYDTVQPLAELVRGLCTSVPGLRRLRFSSLEPGDLTGELLAVLRAHEQCVPHFHLPLQSGSDTLLRRMNRQYTRDDYLRMIDRVHDAFDRPAITTDIIVGFPGETEAEFQQTLEVVDRVKFVHVHAFSFSPRPGTAAARWTRDYVRGPVVNHRIDVLNARSREHGYAYRQRFVGQNVEILVERETASCEDIRHGRCERYFDVHFSAPPGIATGDVIRLRIDRVTPQRTWGWVER